MAEANCEKYDMSDFLNISTNLKCVACKMILNKAHQVQCACRYCRHCLDELLTSECYYCIGNKPRCAETKLIDAQFDYCANDEISHLIVKCPQKVCSFKCELVDMCDHVRLCDQGSVKCPFYDQGCCNDKMQPDQMEQHMQLNNYNHNKILLEMIDNNRNGVAVLSMKEAKIEFLAEQMRIEKEEIDAWQRRFENKIDQIVSDMNSQLRDRNEEIYFLKAENARLEDRLEKLEDRVGGIGEIAGGPDGGIGHSCSEAPSTRVIGCMTCVGGNVFHWDIDDVTTMKRETEVRSGAFHVTSGHKLALVAKHFNGDELWLSLCVWCDLPGPPWPFSAQVTIKIFNKNNPATSRQTNKPIIIDHRQTSYLLSDPYYFTYSDLTGAGIVSGNRVTVECSVE